MFIITIDPSLLVYSKEGLENNKNDYDSRMKSLFSHLSKIGEQNLRVLASSEFFEEVCKHFPWDSVEKNPRLFDLHIFLYQGLERTAYWVNPEQNVNLDWRPENAVCCYICDEVIKSLWKNLISTFYKKNENDNSLSIATWEWDTSKLLKYLNILIETTSIININIPLISGEDDWNKLIAKIPYLPAKRDGDCKIIFEAKNSNKHRGLKNYLEKIANIEYVTKIQTFYYNKSLNIDNYFQPTKEGLDQVEGGFSNAGKNSKFAIYFKNDKNYPGIRDKVISDLEEKILKRK